VRLLLVAGDGDLHRRRGKEEGKKSIQTPLLLGFSCGPTRRQWRWRVEKTRRHCLAAPEILLNTVPACRRCSLKIPDCFGAVIVIFVYLFLNLYFVLWMYKKRKERENNN